jgi:Carboxypeptidase regulatory-like domain
MKMTVASRGALVALFCGASLIAQTQRDARPMIGAPATGKSAIRGIVVSADLGRPVRRVSVSLTGGDPKTSKSTQTDEQGAFEFTDLPAGEFTLAANKGGFVESIYGQKQPGSGRPGTPIRLIAGQQLKDISLPIARGGVITGRVLDEVGDPAFGMNVRLYRWVMQSGERTLQPGASDTTDDRGIYRIPALVPGEYVVGVVPSSFGNVAVRLNGVVEYAKVLEAFEVANGEASFGVKISPRAVPSNAGVPKTGFAPAFYPGVAQVSASTTITLGPSEERPGVDFNLQIVQLAQLSGVVTGTTGPVPGAAVQLVDTTQPVGFGGKSARTGPDGRFVFEGLPPGPYSLMTRATPKGGAQLEGGAREAVEFLATIKEDGRVTQVSKAINAVAPMWASTDVVLDGRDLTDVQLVLQPGLTVSGRVTVDTGTEPPLTRMTVGFVPVGLQKGDQATVGPAAVEPNGRFSIKGVTPGRYRLQVMGGMPSGFSLASAVFGGQDILDVPMEITGTPNVGDGVVTLTTKTTDVSGHIQDAAGVAVSGVTVIVYPADERLWVPESRRIQAARPATDGRYQFRNLPPGDYRLIAVSDIEPGRWYDPALLRQLAGFATFSLPAGGKHVQDFRLK